MLVEDTGWEKIRVPVPSSAGTLEIKFITEPRLNSQADKDHDYLFIGSPALYAVKDNRRNKHVNVVYLLFDLLARDHIDLYKYYNEFSTMRFEDAVNKIGKRRIITPVIDKYADRICLFEKMNTVGQVTRPSIVPLWTSEIYTKCRQPVFRNIVTEENKREFYNQGFATLGNELSGHGYFTKQISCNAQGHGVSGVGVDLGFDEVYDYTMEPSELPENFRRIIEFLKDNQNRKFFLYSHINVPHPPRWIPAWYFISSLPDTRFNINSAKILGNIRYLNDSLGKVLNAVEKLHLLENTIIIIAADHSMKRTRLLRGEDDRRASVGKRRESQRVADYYSRAIYARGGTQFLLGDYMNIPWVFIKPDNLNFQPGRINSFISTLDISPTMLDIIVNKKERKFSGRSFKDLLLHKDKRDKVFSDFIPLVGRFQNGFIINGRYKYYINLLGMYKFKVKENKRYLMQQEYLYDLEKDPGELNNLVHDPLANGLLGRMRDIYFNRFVDYPDKNFFQISPTGKAENYSFVISNKSPEGRIVYPKIYGEGIKYRYDSQKKIIFNCSVKESPGFFSFESDPPDSALSIYILKNGKPLARDYIYSCVESINYFKNPVILNDKIDFHIAREPGRTGLEIKNIPGGSVFFSRIPLIYWMEMNLSDKDIKLSPGIKEVLRGWGYIQ